MRRYIAFFLKSREPAAARLRNFIDKAAQATRAGDVFDDAATGQGLLNFVLRGVNCGAFTSEEAASSGLTMEELRSRSFVSNSGEQKGVVEGHFLDRLIAAGWAEVAAAHVGLQQQDIESVFNARSLATHLAGSQ